MLRLIFPAENFSNIRRWRARAVLAFCFFKCKKKKKIPEKKFTQM